jgi:hypothetical protein
MDILYLMMIFETPAVTTIEGAGYYPQAGINFLVGMTLKF